MPIYLEVGAVRVQRYLTRLPTLKGVRGASAALAATARPTDAQLATWGVRANDEAGDIDGVISVLVPDGTSNATGIAADVLSWFRREVPGVELEARFGAAPSYVEWWLESRRGPPQLLHVPAVSELPLARRCSWCQIDHASRLVGGGPQRRKMWVCADCSARHHAADRRNRVIPEVGLDAERSLYQAIRPILASPEEHWSTDFTELATLGRDKRRNHLASIVFDGDDIGRYLQSLDGDARAAMPGHLSAAVKAALEAATMEVDALVPAGQRPKGREAILPVVAHLRGGDDVSVTLPASLGWPFARQFCETWRTALQAATGSVETPTVSAGLVSCHATYPWARSFALAHELLDRAKAAGGDRVAWIDVTTHGECYPTGRSPLSRQDLADRATALDALAAVEPSSRSTLLRLLAADDPDEIRTAKVATTARRLGLGPVIAPFVGDLRLADALNLVRWWR